jgi:RNA polymerase sigma-70 factor (ECF subfamily)
LPRAHGVLGKVLPAPSLYSDRELGEAILNADEPRAVTHGRLTLPLDFEHVYRTFFQDVRRWTRALGGPEAEREDLVQDVFLIVHRRLADFDGENLVGWLYQITRHRVRDFRRLRWFRLFWGKAQIDDSFASPTEGPESALNRKEKEQLLARLLSKLPEGQRAAFVLFEIEGYSGEEIARFQGVAVNTVWARIHKARRKLAIDLERLGKSR